MRKCNSGLLLLSFLFLAAQLHSQGFLKTDGKKIVNEKGENVLLRGMGLGGWMLQEGYMLRVRGQQQQHRIRARLTELMGASKTEEFYNAWLANHTRKIDIDSMKAWGFNSVRLPMHFNLYTLPVDEEPEKGKDTWLEKGFQMTDSLLAWCKANKMYLILDLHAAPGGQGNDLNIADRDPSKPSLWESGANQKKTIELWKKLAARYVNEPWIGAYDIINEPNWGFEDPTNDKNGTKEKKNEPLKKLMVEITAAIRDIDKKHIIIIEGNGWGNNYNGIFPPWDDNMVLSYHKYWNFNDQSSIKHIIEARDKYNIPVWLGETGENSNVWFADAIKLLEDNNIGWAWWPLKKLGINNPMQIQSNQQYEKILNYWGGDGPKPTAEETYSGAMQLADATKLENTSIKRDVIDAMFRQPHFATSKPFAANTVSNNKIINAVEYDLGRNGIAYFDNDTANYHVATGKRTAGNRGNIYRNDGVDIRADSITNGEFYVSHTEAGEWLQYTLTAPKKGSYHLKIKYSSKSEPARIAFRLNGKSQTVDIPKSEVWSLVEVKNLEFIKGENKMRVIIEKGGVDLKSIQFVKVK